MEYLAGKKDLKRRNIDWSKINITLRLRNYDHDNFFMLENNLEKILIIFLYILSPFDKPMKMRITVLKLIAVIINPIFFTNESIFV